MKYLLSSVAIVAAVAMAVPASAQCTGPGLYAETRTGPWANPPEGPGPSSPLFNLPEGLLVCQARRLRRGFDCMGAATPAAKCDIPCGWPAITLTRADRRLHWRARPYRPAPVLAVGERRRVVSAESADHPLLRSPAARPLIVR